MSENGNYIQLIDESIRNVFKRASGIALKDPSQAYFLLKTIRWQKKAAETRGKWREGGIHVPPFMFISITNRCNLRCKGCFPQAKHRLSMSELNESKLREIMEEARELGISFILLAGGEPLVRPEILKITKDFPEIIFLSERF
jgi:2-iminoacetate synthase ThiH